MDSWWAGITEELLEVRVVSSRGRIVPRGVKRKMSGYAIRRTRGPTRKMKARIVLRNRGDNP